MFEFYESNSGVPVNVIDTIACFFNENVSRLCDTWSNMFPRL